MARLADLPPTARVLEIGAGQGAMAVRLCERFVYTGIEADERSAQVATERLRASGLEGTFHIAKFEDVNFDGPYDVICAFEVLEHIHDDVEALVSWRELLRPGGLMILSVPAWQNKFGPWDTRVGHFRRYDPGDLLRVLRAADLTDVDTTLYGFPLGSALEVVRNLLLRWRPAPDASQGTADSGRLFQPSSQLSGLATEMLTRPFRALQRWGEFERLGTGLVAAARRPV